jgi:hypothetical protein
MRRLLRWYGANPLHLLALLGSFALAGYAAAMLVLPRPLVVVLWFAGAVAGHDLLLLPLYSLADRSVIAAIRHRAPSLATIAWVNYLRVPAALSLLLLLVWSPLILRLRTHYHASTTLSPNPYLWHWLAVTGTLFLLSAAAFALRLRAAHAGTGPNTDRTGELSALRSLEFERCSQAGEFEDLPGAVLGVAQDDRTVRRECLAEPYERVQPGGVQEVHAGQVDDQPPGAAAGNRGQAIVESVRGG